MAAQDDPQQHAPRHARREIEDLEEQWRQATLTSDVASMDRLLSDDYVGTSWTGQVNTKATQLDRIKNHTLQIRRMDLTDVKVKLVGPVAIVTCRADMEGTNDGKPISGSFRYTRVYQHVPAVGWKITSFEATKILNPGRAAKPPGPRPS
jgi:ketosteroid isomerase-like protein